MVTDEEVEAMRDEVEGLREELADVKQEVAEQRAGDENALMVQQLSAEKERLQAEIDAARGQLNGGEEPAPPPPEEPPPTEGGEGV